MDNSSYTTQLQIIHLSDIHFGEHHICNPPPTASSNGIPTLAKLLTDDLKKEFGTSTYDVTDYSKKIDSPLIVVASGDFTQKANNNEFDQAFHFLNELSSKKLLNRKVGKENFFIVPGNHDVNYKGETIEERFQQYCTFYNKFYEDVRPSKQPHKANQLTQLHIKNLDGNKFVIAEINCCMYVANGTVDSKRGQVDLEAIKNLRLKLEEFNKTTPDHNNYIKIAVMHHHIVLLPSFIESERGIDSIMNAGYLLELLSEHNFNMILHGHKHYPQIFNYEPVPLWSENNNKIPQVIISGGSCGSKELPNQISTNACNTYSIITIKWHPEAKQSRIKVITRGLKTKDTKPISPDRWEWETINISDKIITPYKTIPKLGNIKTSQLSDDTQRKKYYNQLRFFMPTVEVMPSLIPGQAYEVRGWIVKHKPELNTEHKLIKVEWSAGKLFKEITCLFGDNPSFSFSYHYWGPMLVQAKLFFDDGHEATSYIYARMPKEEL